MPDIKEDEPSKQHFKRYLVGFFHLINDDSNEQLKMHFNDFMGVYDFRQRLKFLRRFTLCDYVCVICTSDPENFITISVHGKPCAGRMSFSVHIQTCAEEFCQAFAQ